MKATLWIFSLFLASLSSHSVIATTEASSGSQGTLELDQIARRTGEGLDLNVDLGAIPNASAVLGGSEFSRRLSVRAEIGYLFVEEPRYWSLGGTVGLGPRHTLQLGPYINLVHLWTGLWGGGALLIDTSASPIASVSAGWSIVGVEFQASDLEPLFFIKLRIPIGIPLFASQR